jgi:hypothetical protein
MTQLNDESALRAVLADLTAGQPPAPPDRLTFVRRRVVRQRRRRLAGIAAAVAVLAAAAVTIPLGLHAVWPAPQAPQRHYHVSEQPPGPGARPGLVATARLNGARYQLLVERVPGIKGEELSAGTIGSAGIDTPPALAGRTGDPASFTVSVGKTPQVTLGTVRSDVAYLTVTYSNGQVLTVRPVDTLGPKYAPFVVLITPYPAAVVRVTAYSRTAELGSAVPFTGNNSVQTVGWLRPGQLPQTHPITRVIGSGTIAGTAWHVVVWTGAWGTCLYGSSGASYCWDSPSELLGPPHSTVNAPGAMFMAGDGIHIYPGTASPAVSYLIVTRKGGSATRVPLVAAGSLRFYSYADAPGSRVVRWAAYSAAGLRLAAGSGEGP